MAELEAMKDALVPYMNDYGIFSLDADEIPNKVRIEVYERSPGLGAAAGERCGQL